MSNTYFWTLHNFIDKNIYFKNEIRLNRTYVQQYVDVTVVVQRYDNVLRLETVVVQ